MAPYCISITTRYFPIINNDNNIHIKSIKIHLQSVMYTCHYHSPMCKHHTSYNTDNRNPSTQSQMSVPGRGAALYLRNLHHLLHGFWAQLHKCQPGSCSDGAASVDILQAFPKHCHCYTTGHTKAFHPLFLLPREASLTEKGDDFFSYSF